MLSTSSFSYRWVLVAAAAAVAVVPGCSDPQGPTAEREAEPSTLGALIVSNPALRLPAPVVSAGDSTVYASLPPGAIPDGTWIAVRTRRTGAQIESPLWNGGLDPLRIAAEAEDTLDIRVTLADGVIREFVAVVPREHPPVVVRTDPPPGKRDVPLNSVLLIVFSEPIDGASLSAAAVQLSQNGTDVPGTLDFADVSHLRVTFTPAAPLAADAAYELEVTGAITDLNGTPLATPVTVGFVTQSAQPPQPSTGLAGSFERLSLSSAPITRAALVLHDDLTFALEYEADWNAFTYAGHYTRSDSILTFDFDVWSSGQAWEAGGTIRGDTLVVTYNSAIGLPAFEDGVYVRGQTAHWEPLGSAENRFQPGGAVLNGLLYVAGGVRDSSGTPVFAKDILAYDPASDGWRTVGTLARPVRSPAVAAVGNRLYVMGGCVEGSSWTVDDLQIFNPATGTVVVGPPVPLAACGMAAVVLNGRIHLIGGVYQWEPADILGTWAANHSVFDPATGIWSSLAPLPQATGAHAMAVVGGKIYVWGGLPTGLQVYDPATDSWTQPTSGPTGRFGAAAAVMDGKIYFLGGGEYQTQCCGGPVASAVVQRYDPATDVWEQAAPMSMPRSSHIASLINGTIYVFGSGNLERYTPQ